VTRIILIRPKYFSVWESLGLGYIGAYIKEHRPDVELSFYDGFFDSDDEIVKGCRDADIVGITATSPQMKHGLDLAAKIKEVNPECRIVFGGFHPSALPEETVSHPQVDQVVVGEGEKPMLEILNGNREPIIYGEPIGNLDSLPWPDRDLIRVDRTIALTEKNDGERITSVQGGRGCPYRCIFCGEHIITKRNVRRRSIDHLLDEIEYVVDKYRIDFLKFCDAEINPPPYRDWVKEFCREAIKREIDVEFGANIHASNVDLEMFQLMKWAGFREVWIGVESGSSRILREIKKGASVEHILRAFKLSKQVGLFRRAYFMVGFPTETFKDYLMTLRLAEKIEADSYGITILAPYPGTVIYERYRKALNLDKVDWSQIDEYVNPVWRNDRDKLAAGAKIRFGERTKEVLD